MVDQVESSLVVLVALALFEAFQVDQGIWVVLVGPFPDAFVAFLVAYWASYFAS